MTDELIFIDTNILMELLFRRSNYDLAMNGIMSLRKNCTVCVSIVSLATVLYFVESQGFDKKIAHNFMKGYKILDMNNDDYIWAEKNDQGDFEDALQTACARRYKCSYILTLDKKFAKMYGKFFPVHMITQ